MRSSARCLLLTLLVLLMLPGPAAAESPVFPGPGAPPNDAVFRALLDGGDAGPETIFEVRTKLLGLGGELETHIVANRGFHNPEAGSFSFFESYTGPIPGGRAGKADLFLGYFSERTGDLLAVQSGFGPGLMIELIAWDFTKLVFNYWELIGDGEGSAWHYRGDSRDILADIERINVGDPRPAFGRRLRCSGCHTLGGPILKEMLPPHNDWWSTALRLELGTMKLAPGPDPRDPVQLAGRLFQGAQDAWNLGQQVQLGVDRMLAARAERGGDGQDLRRRLRPLFGTMELALASDRRPFDDPGTEEIEVPEGFFVDARLAGPTEPVRIPRAVHVKALAAVGSRFAPEEVPGLAETRHAFLVPVRAYSDDRAVSELVRAGLLDEELVADVLAVDLTAPVFSAARQGLLRHVPEAAANAAELAARLQASLTHAGDEPAARELLLNLTDPVRTAAFHRERARKLVETCRRQSQSLPSVVDWLRIVSQRRVEVAAAETSRNPRGQILEPGFRVIFPVDRLASRPGRLRLSEMTGRAEGAE